MRAKTKTTSTFTMKAKRPNWNKITMNRIEGQRENYSSSDSIDNNFSSADLHFVWSGNFCPRKINSQKFQLLYCILYLFRLTISRPTNLRIEILEKRKRKTVQITSSKEIEIILGRILLMSPTIQMYWSKNKSLPNQAITETIMSKLYLDNPENLQMYHKYIISQNDQWWHSRAGQA